ncbi:hypothetical protein SAPIO_CDS6730 [Scedosporium apiospermum]|uniref:VTC domain-containing protein n=1 Tax=Pseudallescheria apiosperma TaxID=563466 RepID=A0A084G343_PSEDA|nr:uncharacterized protein SAPIO_CDS6730 [Scedosporium apiospermum]KEZ41755.1 hypothetical protein SAPIO_CDS6730 [Scedosporium apiospermum]
MYFGGTVRECVYTPWKDKYIDYAKFKSALREDRSEDDENRFCDEIFTQIEKLTEIPGATRQWPLSSASIPPLTSSRSLHTPSPLTINATPKKAKSRKLKKYGNIKYIGSLKIVKKHDHKRRNRYEFRPIMQLSLAEHFLLHPADPPDIVRQKFFTPDSRGSVSLAVTTMQCHLILAFTLFALCPLGKQIKANLQWSICDADPQTVLQKLGEDGTREPYKTTPITYYDIDPPSYSWGGLMFRTKTRRGEELSAVKVHFNSKMSDDLEAPIVEANFNRAALDTSERFLCVWDRYGNDTDFTCQIQSLLGGRKELWTDEQIRFAERCQSVTWGDLVGFGPNPNPKWRLNISSHRAVFDDVQVGPFHLMELEVKVLKDKGDEVYEKISRYLREHDIFMCHKQEPRTIRLFQAMGYDGSYHNLVKQSG